MPKKMSVLILVGVGLLSIFFPSMEAFAQTPQESFVSFAQCSGPNCSACNVVKIANGMIKWFIGFTFLLFAALLALAGVKLVTSGGNPSALQSAKDSFVNALIGFLIILSAWLIVDTIMKGLVGDPETPDSSGFVLTKGERSGWLFWSEVECMEQTRVATGTPQQIDLRFDINVYGELTPDGSSPALPAPPGVVGSNCGINEGTLVNIPGQSPYRATADTVSRFQSMQSNLARQGIRLNVTSAYRSDAEQTRLWDQCPICQREGTVARPCSRGGNGSRHTSGVALDLNSSGTTCDIVRACRAAGASFIMTYERTSHVHCDWGGGPRREVRVNCP